MLDIVRDLSPRVEYYSIDEFFFDATPPRGLDPHEYAATIRDPIMERGRRPGHGGDRPDADAGQAHQRHRQAVRGRGRPGPRAEEAVLAKPPVTEVTGIAGRRERRLLPWGITTCLDLASADRRLVRELLTATGEALWWELRGESVLAAPPAAAAAQDPLPGRQLRRGDRPARRPLGLAGPQPGAAGRGAGVPRGPARAAWRSGSATGTGGRARAGRPWRRRATGSTCCWTCSGPACGRAWIPRAPAGRMHLFAEKLTPKLPTPAGALRRGRESGRGGGQGQAGGQPAARAVRRRSAATLPLVGVYRDPANEYDICDVRGKMCF